MGCVAAEVMKQYVERWADHNKLTEHLHISLCSIWIKDLRRPAVRIWAHTRDLMAIMMLEDEKPKFIKTVLGNEQKEYGTLKYYCEVGGYERAPTKLSGLVKFYPVEINSADKATKAAYRYALSPLCE